mmetsp:Transcript_15973/g.22240  ORF Transcript_15973/g.22240 Transcript_15973/m.22240 type:complete len:350 (-) Transcript_15973:984-2033(-)
MGLYRELLFLVLVTSVICATSVLHSIRTSFGFNVEHPSTVAPSQKFMSQNEILAAGSGSAEVMLPTGYAVLDIGASKGGATTFLKDALTQVLGDKRDTHVSARTLGLDIDPSKVEVCKASGNECMQGDAAKLSPSGAKVGGVTMWHVLEHMPNCELSTDIWQRTSSIAKHFSSFRGPSFDDKDSLRGDTMSPPASGLHRYYENWSGHTCHFDSQMLSKAITSSPRRAEAYIVALMKPIKSSESNVILPPRAKVNSHHYNASTHPPKEIVNFNRTVYEEMRACAVYENFEGNKSLSIDSALALRDVIRAMDSRGGKPMFCYTKSTESNEACVNKLRSLYKKTILEYGGRP